MDVLAHGLWTNIMYKVIPQTKDDKKMRWWGIALGVLPDLISFTPIFMVFFYQLYLGSAQFIEGRPDFENMTLSNLTQEIYNYTHSLVVWILFTIAVWAIWKRFHWVMLGWGLHVIIDIFSHSLNFYPTPFLFPFSDAKVNGVPWAHPIFMALNYGLLAILYFFILPLYFKKKNLEQNKTA